MFVKKVHISIQKFSVEKQIELTESKKLIVYKNLSFFD